MVRLPTPRAWLVPTLCLGVLLAACSADPAPGNAPAPSAHPPAADAALTAAVTRYHDHVVGQVDALQSATTVLTTAVRDRDVAAAKSAYARAHAGYLPLAPVAESVGTLDDDIDAQRDDAPDPLAWKGFHRIEKALWVDGSLAGMTPVADRLDRDVATLKQQVAEARFRPADLAAGMCDLLTEVSTTVVTGDEDSYAHTDLTDLAANVASARAAFALLEPALTSRDAELVRRIQTRFTEVDTRLDAYRRGRDHLDYADVSQPARRRLADAVNALAEPLSLVASRVAA